MIIDMQRFVSVATNPLRDSNIQRKRKQSRTKLKCRLEPSQHFMSLLSISEHEIDE